MPKRKTIKRKTCRKTKKTTGMGEILFATLGPAIASATKNIANALPGLWDKLGNVAMTALGYASSVANFVAPKLWEAAKYLSDKGLRALTNIITGLWSNTHKKTINTTQIKNLLSDMLRKIERKDPRLKDDPIMNDIYDLTRLCFYIDSLNQNGMTDVEYEDMRNRITESLKYLIPEFGKLMNPEEQTINQTPEPTKENI